MNNQAAENLDGLDNLDELLRPVTQLHINKLDKAALIDQLRIASTECDAEKIISLFHSNSSSEELTAQEVTTIYCTYLLQVINTDITKLDQALPLSRTLSRNNHDLLARLSASCINLLTRYAPDTKTIRELIVELSGYSIPVRKIQEYAMTAARQGKAKTFSILNEVIGQWEVDAQGVLMFWMFNTSKDIMDAVRDQPVIGISSLIQSIKRNPETLCGVIHACLGQSVAEYRSAIIEYIMYEDRGMAEAIKVLTVKYGSEFENYQLSLMTPGYGSAKCMAALMENRHTLLTAQIANELGRKLKAAEIRKALQSGSVNDHAQHIELINIAQKASQRDGFKLRMKKADDPIRVAFERGNEYIKSMDNLKRDLQGVVSEQDILLGLFYAICRHGLKEGVLHNQLDPVLVGSLSNIANNTGKTACSRALSTIKLMLSEDKRVFHSATERKVRVTH